MIFPLVIAGVMAVLYIVIGMYLSLSLQTSLHLALRKESGEFSQTVYRLYEIKEFPFEMSKSGLRPILMMEEEREYRGNKLFNQNIYRKEKGRAYLIDEAEIIRIFSLAKEVT